MFEFAIIIGIYSYIIFFLGLFGVLYKEIILASTLIYIFLVIFYFLKIKKLVSLKYKAIKLDKLSRFLIFILISQAIVNLIGALGPELAFDSLWYHLTLPKLYLENHSIFHISGGLLYYSEMPKSVEMLYVFALSLDSEILAKFIHYLFGILSLVAIYKLSRIFLPVKVSLLACVIFYSNLVVGWESVTSYVDLGWAFFEISALYYFLLWFSQKKFKYLVYCAILIGFSISSKIISFNSIAIFSLLILYISFISRTNIKIIIRNVVSFITISILIPLPWFVFSFINTGNPFYPLLQSSVPLENSSNLLDILKLFIYSPDPINPIYLIFLPIFLLFYKNTSSIFKLLSIYSFIAIIFWVFVSSIGGTRFLIPYLGVFSILSASLFIYIKNGQLIKYFYLLVFIIAFSSIFYRAAANFKYVPFVFGIESKETFLSKNLNYSFADFYDTDAYFKNNIKSSDKVLLFGFHNLYYVNFPFIDSSWVKKGDRFNYIAVQSSSLPQAFSNWKEIYYNKQTGVKLYSLGGKVWVY